MKIIEDKSKSILNSIGKLSNDKIIPKSIMSNIIQDIRDKKEDVTKLFSKYKKYKGLIKDLIFTLKEFKENKDFGNFIENLDSKILNNLD